MTLEKIKISNFKGIRKLEIDFGSVTRISGMNGTGKTTIPDAFCWVLWNKDSRGNAPGSYDFHEKPLDEYGEEIHNLDTTVELDCRLDGQRFNIKRTQRENWVQKRGSTEAVFQGNTSTYWINDVETKLSDFKARISQITSEEIFRLIGSLSAFNALDWKKRREQLIALSDADVDEMLLQQEKYRPLADECGQRGIEVDNLRKVLSDQRKRTNDELRMIPVRIDEARKAMPEFKPNEVRDAEYIVKDTISDIERINGYIAEIKAQTGATGYSDQILALETEALSLQRTVADGYRADMRKLEQERSIASDSYRRTADALADTKRRLERDQKELSEAEAARDALRADYRTEYERRFVPPETDGICPTCKQPLPEDIIRAAIDEARKAFDAEKKAKLLDIKKRGTDKGAEITSLEESVERNGAEIADLEKQLTTAEAERDAAYEKIKAMPTEPDYSSEPRIAELLGKVEELKVAQKESPSEKIAEYEHRKAELQAIVDRNRAILARRDAGLETEKRIQDLERQQQEKAARIAELEQLIALVEQFVQDRCRALEDSINAKFPTVRWKLFEIQINGGINDVCQAYIPCGSSLVSYGSANTASQVNADIEIINVLSEHYELYLPLFADNSERVNVIAPTKSQFISLAVSTDSELKIETKEAV
jgi:DNA repair exonuclease SbcCD ATPase subunit